VLVVLKKDALSPAFLNTLIVSEYSSAVTAEPASASAANIRDARILFTIHLPIYSDPGSSATFERADFCCSHSRNASSLTQKNNPY